MINRTEATKGTTIWTFDLDAHMVNRKAKRTDPKVRVYSGEVVGGGERQLRVRWNEPRSWIDGPTKVSQEPVGGDGTCPNFYSSEIEAWAGAREDLQKQAATVRQLLEVLYRNIEHAEDRFSSLLQEHVDSEEPASC